MIKTSEPQSISRTKALQFFNIQFLCISSSFARSEIFIIIFCYIFHRLHIQADRLFKTLLDMKTLVMIVYLLKECE